MDGPECSIKGCDSTVTRHLTVAMETRQWTPKIVVETCKRHGDELDESGGRYLVTESIDLPRDMDRA